VVTCPLAFYGAFIFGLFGPAGGTASAAVEETLLVVAVGALIWRWRPSKRHTLMRAVTVVIVCASLALGGASLVNLIHGFNDPAWNS
jgi:hypothetical protein